MPTIFQHKELAATETPMLLFDCALRNGQIERWSTHALAVDGAHYSPRVMRHNLFELQAASNLGVDSIPKVSITLANADSHFSEIERAIGWKGASVTVQFVFFKLKDGAAGDGESDSVQGRGQSARRNHRIHVPPYGHEPDEHAACAAASGTRGEALSVGVPKQSRSAPGGCHRWTGGRLFPLFSLRLLARHRTGDWGI